MLHKINILYMFWFYSPVTDSRTVMRIGSMILNQWRPAAFTHERLDQNYSRHMRDDDNKLSVYQPNTDAYSTAGYVVRYYISFTVFHLLNMRNTALRYHEFYFKYFVVVNPTLHFRSLNLNLNSLLVIRQMTLFHKGFGWGRN